MSSISPRYLKAIDKFNEWTVSAFVAPQGQPEPAIAPSGSPSLPLSLALNQTVSLSHALPVKFILLHETKNDEGIRQFFLDVWESYVKVRASHPSST